MKFTIVYKDKTFEIEIDGATKNVMNLKTEIKSKSIYLYKLS